MESRFIAGFLESPLEAPIDQNLAKRDTIPSARHGSTTSIPSGRSTSSKFIVDPKSVVMSSVDSQAKHAEQLLADLDSGR